MAIVTINETRTGHLFVAIVIKIEALVVTMIEIVIVDLIEITIALDPVTTAMIVIVK
jgi:hypothetical protein